MSQLEAAICNTEIAYEFADEDAMQAHQCKGPLGGFVGFYEFASQIDAQAFADERSQSGGTEVVGQLWVVSTSDSKAALIA